MWPWGHLALGYLLYSGTRRVPSGLGTLALALVLGSQVPDLLDKPLAWLLGVLPTGRSLGHSLPFAVLVLAVLALVVRWWIPERPELGVAYGVGHLSHLLGDALYPVLAGEFAHLAFLGYPLVPPFEYDIGQSVGAHLALIEFSPAFVFELVLVALAVGIRLADGRPGLATLGIGDEPPPDEPAD